MRPLHSIFWDYFIDKRLGGPPGYLAHLRAGLDLLPPNPNVEIWIDCYSESHFPKSEKRSLTQGELRSELIRQIRYFENPGNFELSHEEFARLMRRRPKSVHLHTSPLAYKVIRTFKRHGIDNIPVILTSHTPESNGKEMADQYRVPGMEPSLVQHFEDCVRFIEALAFQSSDIWVFPSREAMEPYYATIPDFERWERGRDIRFIETGASQPRQSVATGQAKAHFGLSGRKVVSFIGRHNEVKGYDIFCRVASRLLEMREDVSVLVAGAPNPHLPPPVHQRWTELGWYGFPGDVLAASDIYVLPNRMTYYDLILIEALAIQAPIVASATGGNKSVAEQTKGAILLYDGSEDELLKKILILLERETPQVQAILGTLEHAYERFYTPEKFAQRYETLIEGIHEDYKIV